METKTGAVIQATDPKGLLVTLGERAWRHISTDHPEMKDRLDDIIQAIKTPNIIEADPIEPDGRRYYWLKPVSFGKYSKLYVLVVVVVDKESVRGSVCTAHLIEKPKGGTVLWARK
jgi:hypothetical protein